MGHELLSSRHVVLDVFMQHTSVSGSSNIVSDGLLFLVFRTDGVLDLLDVRPLFFLLTMKNTPGYCVFKSR